MNRIITAFILGLPLAFTQQEAAAPNKGPVGAGMRDIRCIDTDWRFHLGDDPTAKSFDFDDSGWRSLDVPHDWSIEGDYNKTNPTKHVCGHLLSGIGWYRRKINMPDAWKGKVVKVGFEGVYMNSEVWLNGERLGGRAYGYMTFECDLTRYLKPGRNVLAVRVDHSFEPSARWYHGCGIYGHVRLIATAPVHVPASGVYVLTPEVAAVEVRSDSEADADVRLELWICDPFGTKVSRTTASANVQAGETATMTRDLKVIRPSLWSQETPALYTLKRQVLAESGHPLDDCPGIKELSPGVSSHRLQAGGGRDHFTIRPQA